MSRARRALRAPGIAMDILIQGVGAVGGVLAAEVIRAGGRVTLVTGNDAITSAIRDRGLELRTPERAFTAAAQVHTSLDEVPASRHFDTVWLTMKANHVVAAAAAACARLAPTGCLVAFQNGLVEDALGTVLPPGRLLLASVAFGATMTAPGVYRRTTARAVLHIGEPSGTISPRLEQLAGVLGAAVPVTLSRNIAGVLWGKLGWNCAVSGLCAVAACSLGQLVARADGRALFLRVYTEVLETAARRGVAIERAVVDHTRFHCRPGQTAAEHAAQLAAVAALAGPYGEVVPSIVQSLARGRPTEIAWLNGELVRQATSVGMAVPVNAAITRLVQDLEQGTRTAGEANLGALADLVATPPG